MTNRFSQFVEKANRFAQFVQGGPEPVATTKDGGTVFRMSDGSLSFKSPGYATNDQEAIARLMDGATSLQEAQRTTDELTIAQNPIAARAQEFNQGAPIVGEWLDEAVGLFNPKAAKAMRQTSDAMERQNPVQSAALNVAGGVAYTAPLIAAGGGSRSADFIAGGKSKVGQATRAAGVGAGAGATEGASAFAGRADPGERGQGAVTGAMVGGGLGAALGVFAPMLGEGVTNLARRVRKLDVRVIAEQFGISQPAARVVKGYLANDDLASASKYLARAGDDAMLAESGPATRQALDTAMSTGGEALATARPRVDQRIQGASSRWLKTLDDVLGTADGGIKGAARDISKSTAAARKAAYDRAYAQPTPMAGEAGDRLQDVLARIDPRDFDAAMREAAAEARNDGLRNLNIMASIDEAGNVTFTQPPSVQELDYLARGLNNLVDAGTDKITGQMSPAARRAASQARALRDVLKDTVDGYAQALKLGGDKIRQTEALTMGRRLLSETTTVEDVRNAMRDAPDAVKAAARKGLRENLDALMGRARTTIADLEAGNLDFEAGQNAVAEAVAAIRTATTRNNFQKARFVVGTDAKRLFDELEKVGDALVLRAAVARNSATAIRQAGQDAMRAEVAPGLMRETAGNIGSPLDAARGVTRTLAGIDPRSMSEAEAAYFAEIADALTRIKGPEAQRALAAVQNAINGQPLRDAEAQLIGRVVAGSTAVGSYRAGTQALAPQ